MGTPGATGVAVGTPVDVRVLVDATVLELCVDVRVDVMDCEASTVVVPDFATADVDGALAVVVGLVGIMAVIEVVVAVDAALDVLAAEVVSEVEEVEALVINEVDG